MTTIQDTLDQWVRGFASSDSKTNERIQQAAKAIALYADSSADFDWTALETGLGMAGYVLPYCRQYQLLEAAILLPMSRHLTHEQLRLIIQDQDVLTLLVVIRKLDIVDSTYLNQQHTPSNNTQTKLRKMLLALATDIRAVVIKLAQQQHTLQHLPKQHTEAGEHIALLAHDIYGPLANRLGLYHLKWPIEDLSFRYLNTERYMAIAKGLRETRVEREAFIEYAIHQIKAGLARELPTLTPSIKGRAKHIYSIHKKSERKNSNPESLFDMTAVRVLVDTTEACYHVLAYLHNTWEHVPEEYDDYISKPKPNGYQSIHTVLLIKDRLIEVQIRTRAMHQAAELGVAAHWKYKEANASETAPPSINWLNELLRWQEEVTTDKPNVFEHTFANRIYVFTPQNQIIDLAIGATPIDFAYAIHTDIGHRCKGAKIGERLVPLNHPLSTGDIVTILTHKEPHPSHDWLNPERGYVTTRSALGKVKSWFKRQRHDEHLSTGRTIWERHLKRETISAEHMQQLTKHFNLHHHDDLLIALGCGDLHIRTVLRQLRYITKTSKTKIDPLQKATQKTINAQNKTGIIVDGIGSLSTQIARCCRPIPGDPIIGYLTTNHGISIHHQQCHNRQDDGPKRLERRIDAEWGDTHNHLYTTHVRVICEHDKTVSDSLWNTLSQQQATLLRAHSQHNKQRSKYFYHVVMQVKNISQLTAVLHSLNQLKGVLQATRIGIQNNT